MGVGALNESWGDRLSALSRGEIIGLLVVVAATLFGAGFWYMRSLPQPVEIRAAVRPTAGPVSPSSSAIFVDVAGWVKKPGVYEFPEGDRVIDAVEQAGGARKGAVLSSLNLAAVLTDGQQILIPEPVKASAAAASGVDANGLVNINTADATQLESLSGIGEVLSQTIIDYRETNGPFTSVEQLLDVSGIGDATLAEFRDQVTV